METGRVPWWCAAACGVGAWGLTICRGDVPPDLNDVPAGCVGWRDEATIMNRGRFTRMGGDGASSVDASGAALERALAAGDSGSLAVGEYGSADAEQVPAPGVAVLLAAGAGVLLYRRERTGVGAGGGVSDGRGGLP